MDNATREVKSFFKSLLPFIALGIIFFAGTIFLSISEDRYKEKLKEAGVYVVGTITEVSSSNRGLSFHGIYYFKNKKYEMRQSAFRSSVHYAGRKLFVVILPEDPENYVVLFDEYFPDCLKSEENMYKCWKDKPVCD
ncbi:hypothetical protein [Chitinophaga tropicalis]|uniref:DUF3592 domain-containing protein n=1 Tax=Chitinophaga tropicalis TaxID=2683588 RepID=A0A7K1U0U1_9BACT|nr:hypothetical protein [Chitinophaga tropicalis]MVT07963.1 hypothetical protein [Chitinophaga tropicalis]